VLRDSTLITALIFERPTCVQCIGRKTRLSDGAAHTALDVIRRAVGVQCADSAKCQTCGKTARVFSVIRPA
jgi:hypothetical protein